jgi:hypothetical protein
MDLHTVFIALIVAFPILALVNVVYFGLELRSFLARTATLESSLDLLRYRKVVGHQMYAALAQIGLLLAPLLVFIVGILLDVLEASDIVFVIAPALVIIVVAVVFRGWEQHAKTIPAADPELEAQRDAVVRTWMRKPFPDW